MTIEDRVRKQRKALRNYAHAHGVANMWLMLARQWGRPVQEIKRICHGPDWDPVAEREQKNRARAELRARYTQVRDLIDAGRMNEARELFHSDCAKK